MKFSNIQIDSFSKHRSNLEFQIENYQLSINNNHPAKPIEQTHCLCLKSIVSLHLILQIDLI